MNIRIFILLTLFSLGGGLICTAQSRLEFFFEPGCDECEQIEKEILPRLEPDYDVVYRDIGVESNLITLLRLEHQTGYSGDERAYLVLNGQYAFGDPLNDPEAFFIKVEQASLAHRSLGEGGSLLRAESDPVASRFEEMTLPVVLLAGLLDGINPCAISTLVFFMSLLVVSTRRKRERPRGCEAVTEGSGNVRNRQLMLLGISFCLASFLTYLALGFGLLRFLHLFSGFTALRSTVEWGMTILMLVLSVLSFRDALRFRRSGKGEDVTLQLSAGMKKSIHGIMRRGLGNGSLILGGLMIGTAVTALESVCTGQVYVPTLVLILKNSGLAESRAWLYLLSYNLLFILPLVLVFIAVYFGLRTETLLKWSRRDVVFSKTLMGLFFLAMAVLFCLI